MERNIVFSEGEFYHVYNRGVDKRTIYASPEDYDRFVALLYIANDASPAHLSNILKRKTVHQILNEERDEQLVAIGAYCLMPNHYHLLLTQRVDGGISKFMLKLQTAYSMYFNIKNERSGALFQGKFKAEHIESDVQLQYLYAYIHLNPVSLKNKQWKEEGVKDTIALKKFVENYPYSSCRSYIQGLHKITSPDMFPAAFNTSAEFRQLNDFWLEYRNIKGGP